MSLTMRTDEDESEDGAEVEMGEIRLIGDIEQVYPREKPTLALDMDGTLARSKERVFKCIGEDVAHEDIESYDWPGEQFGWDRFLGGFTTAWGQQWSHIEPWEDDIADTVAELRDVFEVHIVTAQPDDQSIIEGKQAWLDKHDIGYDDFVTVPFDETKANLRYDVYVDDKPTLPEKVNHLLNGATMYLIDQPYNQDAPGHYHRVDGVAEVLRHFVYGTTRDPEEVIVVD